MQKFINIIFITIFLLKYVAEWQWKMPRAFFVWHVFDPRIFILLLLLLYNSLLEIATMHCVTFARQLFLYLWKQILLFSQKYFIARELGCVCKSGNCVTSRVNQRIRSYDNRVRDSHSTKSIWISRALKLSRQWLSVSKADTGLLTTTIFTVQRA